MIDFRDPPLSELRDLLQREMELRHAAHKAVHCEQDRALVVAHDALDYRLEGLNNWRSAQRELITQCPTRTEVSSIHAASDLRLAQLTEAVQKLELSHSNLQVRLYTIFGVVTVGMAAVNIVLAVFG